jgi:hypothetical protein
LSSQYPSGRSTQLSRRMLASNNESLRVKTSRRFSDILASILQLAEEMARRTAATPDHHPRPIAPGAATIQSAVLI